MDGQVVYLANLFPYPEKPTGGIFIQKRLKEYNLQSGTVSEVFCLPFYDFSPLLKSLMRLTHGYPYNLRQSWAQDHITYTYCIVKRNMVVMALQKIFPGWNSRIEEKISRDIFNEIRAEKVDLIHAHGMYEVAAGEVARLLSQRSGVPFIVTLHGSDINVVMKRRAASYIYTLEHASKCIFVSNALLKKAESYGYSGKNAVVIPNGYDPTLFFPVDKEKVRTDLGIYKPNTTYVGFVGNLVPVKRADKLSMIFHEVAQRVNNCSFIVVGDGPLRERVQRETRDLDIIFTGRLQQNEVAKWMNAMDIMVLPSRNEGFPTVAVEAAACGTPVIGSSNGGIPEAVGFKELIVTEGRDFEKRFAKKVIDILSMNKSNLELLRTKVRTRVQNFTWQRIVSEEIKVYQDILG